MGAEDRTDAINNSYLCGDNGGKYIAVLPDQAGANVEDRRHGHGASNAGVELLGANKHYFTMELKWSKMVVNVTLPLCCMIHPQVCALLISPSPILALHVPALLANAKNTASSIPFSLSL